MKLSDIVVEVRDKDLNRLGQIPPEDLDLVISDLFNNVGTWTLRLPTDHELAPALRTPGSGIFVTMPNAVFSGPTIKAEAAATSTDPGGTLQVDGVTDTAILTDRLAFPEPSNVDPTTQTLSHDVRTGPIEDLMFAYVDANIGPSAHPARRDSRLTMGTSLHRGTTITKRARFPMLGELVNDLAITASLGFRVVQVGSNLQFQTYAVVDRSQEIRLDILNNTLAGHRVAQAPPSVTRAVVAGQGEMVDRQFVEVTTTESLAGEVLWGRRIERFIDQRQTNDTDELTHAGLEALEDGGFAQFSVQAVPMEDSTMEFGRDWYLGDLVSIVVNGVELADVVTGYVVKIDKDGLKAGAVLGDITLTGDAAIQARLTKVEARVSNLERNDSGQSVQQVTDPSLLYGTDGAGKQTGVSYTASAAPWAVAQRDASGYVALGDSTVTAAKIAAGAVTVNKLFDGSVSTAKLADAGVTAVKIADNAVTNAKMADNSVGTAELVDGSVTNAKLATAVQNKLANVIQGDSAWINVSSFTNGWTNYNASNHVVAAYRKLPNGQVALQGVIKNGTVGSSAFTLPTGYRPAAILICPALEGGNNAGRLDINADGTVVPMTGTNGYYAFCVTFYPA